MLQARIPAEARSVARIHGKKTWAGSLVPRLSCGISVIAVDIAAGFSPAVREPSPSSAPREPPAVLVPSEALNSRRTAGAEQEQTCLPEGSTERLSEGSTERKRSMPAEGQEPG